ncbi:MAG: class I SAM-dependent methyltransferase [Burkholderiales bacterium]|nr:class I SAM-dependent methyltransferase [Burkholderiales bacterium]
MSLRRFLFFRDAPEVSWERYGRENPYYGVLTSEHYRSKALDAETLAAFFTSGEKYLGAALGWVEDAFPQGLRRARALDFGCGAARLVVPLAQRFEEVVGVDVSPSMLAEADKNCAERGIRNARFALTRDASKEKLGTFSFVHSYIVFQHIPPADGERLMRTLVDMLEPGGIALLHVTIARRSALRRTAQWLQRNFVPASWLFNVLRGRPWNTPVMQMNSYSLNRIARLLRQSGIETFGVRVEEHEGSVGAFVLARRPSD